MKKRLISFMLLITVISCVGFNTDYFKNLLTLISQAAKEVIYEETESYDEETTDSAVDRLEQELEKLDVRNFFEDESETESGRKTISLPEYDGTTTHGVLVLDDGTQIGFTSGNGDPRYTNYRNNGHVEQKSALYMRENNISNATVYHNNTNGTCGYCNTMTATFLPEGATLTVVPPENAVANNSRAIDYVKTYTGTSNDPKISPRYKGN